VPKRYSIEETDSEASADTDLEVENTKIVLPNRKVGAEVGVSSSEEILAQASKGAGRQPKRRVMSLAKHTFRWEDNQYLVKSSPYKVGQPVPLVIKLICTKGQEYTFENQYVEKPKWTRASG
jgi:hypothetical protein